LAFGWPRRGQIGVFDERLLWLITETAELLVFPLALRARLFLTKVKSLFARDPILLGLHLWIEPKRMSGSPTADREQPQSRDAEQSSHDARATSQIVILSNSHRSMS
jgi:hypothetical protein